MADYYDLFLSNRLLHVRIRGALSEDGVPQESILCATLFARALNSVISVLLNRVQGSLYVDDLPVPFSAARIPLIEKLQLTLNRISELVSNFHLQKFWLCTSVASVVFSRTYICILVDVEFHT